MFSVATFVLVYIALNYYCGIEVDVRQRKVGICPFYRAPSVFGSGAVVFLVSISVLKMISQRVRPS